MLYKYSVNFDTYDKEKIHKEILKTLREQFGVEKAPKSIEPGFICNLSWDTEKQTVSYLMTVENEKKKSYHVYIGAKYKPFYKEIEELIKKEKKTYF